MPVRDLATPYTNQIGKFTAWVYDAAQNLTVRTNNTTPESFAVNSLNQYTNGPGGTFSYDANGNLTFYGTQYGWQRYYGYDAENQLVSVQVPGYFYTLYTYDGLGRRRVRVEHTWNGSTWVVSQTVRYLYDGLRVIQERDGNNVPTVSYTRGHDLSGSLEGAGGIGGLLARSHGYSGGSWTNHNCYHADGGGNITYLMTSTQGLAARSGGRLAGRRAGPPARRRGPTDEQAGTVRAARCRSPRQPGRLPLLCVAEASSLAGPGRGAARPRLESRQGAAVSVPRFRAAESCPLLRPRRPPLLGA